MLRTAFAAAMLTFAGFGSAAAAPLDRTFTVTANDTGAAVSPFVISFSVAYTTPPTTETTTGISLISASAGWAGTLAYFVQPGSSFPDGLERLVVGATTGGVNGLNTDVDDIFFQLADPGGTPGVRTLQFSYSPIRIIIGRTGSSSSVSVTFVDNEAPTASVPEPGTLALLGTALLGLAGLRRERHATAAGR